MNSSHELIIDHDSTEPIYRQVVDGLRSLLVERRLKPGDLLPTVRELGLELGVHFNTVAQAYRILEAQGWLELRRRRGAVVVRREDPDAGPETEEDFRRSLRQLLAQARSEGLSVDWICRELKRMTLELAL
jgi:GntR family transcriptional regulator